MEVWQRHAGCRFRTSHQRIFKSWMRVSSPPTTIRISITSIPTWLALTESGDLERNAGISGRHPTSCQDKLSTAEQRKFWSKFIGWPVDCYLIFFPPNSNVRVHSLFLRVTLFSTCKLNVLWNWLKILWNRILFAKSLLNFFISFSFPAAIIECHQCFSYVLCKFTVV